MASASHAEASLAYREVLSQKDPELDLITRFYLLLSISEHLVRTSTPTTANQYQDFETRIAEAFASMQDFSTWNEGSRPPPAEMKLFSLLRATSIDLFSHVLDSTALSLEDFGWGIFALSSGYRPSSSLSTPSSSSPPSPSSAGIPESFGNHKSRLRAALLSLPTLTSPPPSRNSSVPPANKINTLAKANREVHVCATMLLQAMRSDWERVRWWHLVAVVERWVRALGLDGKVDWSVVGAGVQLGRED
ncbi:hypothetical protein K469DRAFT_240538 [Zopfia rhizophila CBS 207.26]|uniref:Uncharacterized protein n=1 Tax=Zopfia rhizophila CBS 207.26 TaxID=1314779 RepID=A0A6A6ENE2_9PEZI|nr:hypothetical protein K469DRAFT_240538 [Zopfia rhizophila CBS 207.26]